MLVSSAGVGKRKRVDSPFVELPMDFKVVEQEGTAFKLGTSVTRYGATAEIVTTFTSVKHSLDSTRFPADLQRFCDTHDEQLLWAKHLYDRLQSLLEPKGLNVRVQWHSEGVDLCMVAKAPPKRARAKEEPSKRARTGPVVFEQHSQMPGQYVARDLEASESDNPTPMCRRTDDPSDTD
jgi:hypothetical protein